MCGRYSNNKEIKFYESQMGLDFSETRIEWRPSFNVAPTQPAPVTTADRPGLLELMHFGLVPFWAKDKKISYSMINARQETVLEKAAFKPLFRQGKRCLVYADSFFEWKKVGEDKQPYRIKLIDRDIFAFAGLWSRWKDPEGLDYFSFSIITTTPNELTEEVHNRMPVILTREEEKIWLDMDQHPEDLMPLLTPYPADDMEMYPVSKAVGNVRNNYPELLNPV